MKILNKVKNTAPQLKLYQKLMPLEAAHKQLKAPINLTSHIKCLICLENMKCKKMMLGAFSLLVLAKPTNQSKFYEVIEQPFV